MTYNIITIVCTKWIIGSVPLQKPYNGVGSDKVINVHIRNVVGIIQHN